MLTRRFTLVELSEAVESHQITEAISFIVGATTPISNLVGESFGQWEAWRAGSFPFINLPLKFGPC